MNQLKNMTSVNKVANVQPIKQEQFQYLGRWVNKKDFRAFVYDKSGNQKLANSYNEFESMIASGIWYAQKPDISKVRKHKDDVTLSNSK